MHRHTYNKTNSPLFHIVYFINNSATLLNKIEYIHSNIHSNRWKKRIINRFIMVVLKNTFLNFEFEFIFMFFYLYMIHPCFSPLQLFCWPSTDHHHHWDSINRFDMTSEARSSNLEFLGSSSLLSLLVGLGFSLGGLWDKDRVDVW